MAIHKHLIVRAEVKNPITDPTIAGEWLRKVVDNIGMVITEHGGPYVDYVCKPDNHGIAGIVMIETSHCSLHVWDRIDPPLMQFDIYSCAPFDEKKVLKLLDEMNPINIDHICIDRGESKMNITREGE